MISFLPCVWPLVDLPSLRVSHRLYASLQRQWQMLLGVLVMARKVLVPGADLFALLSISSVELLAMQSPSTQTVEVGVFTWSLLHLTLDLAWLSSIWSQAGLSLLNPKPTRVCIGIQQLNGGEALNKFNISSNLPLSQMERSYLIELWLTGNIYKMSSTVYNTKVFEWYLLLW